MKRDAHTIPSHEHDRPGESRSGVLGLVGLGITGFVSWLIYVRIARLSPQFDYNAPTTSRPIVQVLLLLAMAFACYLVAFWLVRRVPQDARMWLIVLGGAVAFRAALLTSTPIQEIDIYRYLWDGAAVSQGVSPFRYSPEQVKRADADNASLPDDLRNLARLRDDNAAIAQSLARIHFADLPTVYPPASQAVFSAAHSTTPSWSSLEQRLRWMKAWFLVFDLVTMVLVIGLLRLAGQPTGLCLVYGWCPLLMKEVANSGHLDAVAVCLTTLAVLLGGAVLFRQRKKSPSSLRRLWLRDGAMSAAALAVLALAVGAKLYPIVLAPLLLLSLGGAAVREHGWVRGAATSAAAAMSFVAITVGLLWPMLPGGERHLVASVSEDVPADPFPRSVDSRATTIAQSAGDAQDPSLGIQTFLRQWAMNDFLFLIVVENIKPTDHLAPGEVAWFSVVPNPWRHRLVDWGSAALNIDAAHVPFFLTRTVTGLLFIAVAGWCAWRGMKCRDARVWLHYGFLTIAWFWLLCPTQNPWYWIWALPLLPFARARTWMLVSGVCLVYYLRFWLDYHWPEATVLGTPYVGYQFFDFVVTWLEYAPLLTLLVVEWVLLGNRPEEQEATQDSDLGANESISQTAAA